MTLKRPGGLPRLDISGTTRLVALLGDPVGHSVSPRMQNAAFAALDLDYCYVPCLVKPDALRAAVRGLVALDFVGANVTIPHKERIVRYLDEVSPEVAVIGAVNTVLCRRGRLIGYNTDAPGFLQAYTEGTGVSIRGGRFLVLGAGGGARAVAAALASAGARGVMVANRSTARARSLVAHFRRAFPRVDWSVLGWRAKDWPPSRSFRGVVQATSVGMAASDSAPLPAGWLDGTPAVFDLVYNARTPTALRRSARAAGARHEGGLGMLVHQGALAFAMWTGRRAPVEVMRRAVEDPRTPSTRSARTKNLLDRS